MYYVEVFYARKMFTWFASVVVVVASVVLATALTTYHAAPGSHHVPFGIVFAPAGYIGCIMATMLTATLNRDRSHLAYLWTRPTSRERIAVSYMIVDVVTIVVAFFFVAGVTSVVIDNWPGHVLLGDPKGATMLVRFLALPLMWYALVEAATSWNALRGGMVAGISWAVFWVLLLAAAIRMPAPLGLLVEILNVFNPLAYFITERHESILVDPVTLSQVNGHYILALNYTLQTLVAYAIFAAGCVVATYAWRRMEAR